MTITQELAIAAMTAQGLTNKRQLALALGTSAQRVGDWWIKECECDASAAAMMAELAGWPVAATVLRVDAARTTDSTGKAILLKHAQKLAA